MDGYVYLKCVDHFIGPQLNIYMNHFTFTASMLKVIMFRT